MGAVQSKKQVVLVQKMVVVAQVSCPVSSSSRLSLLDKVPMAPPLTLLGAGEACRAE